jgi:hypothetical protein
MTYDVGNPGPCWDRNRNAFSLITKVITVKPVLGGHLWNKEKVAL